jgi:hypothetical protein
VPVTYGNCKTKLDYLKSAATGSIHAVVAAAYLFTAISYGPVLRGKDINN